MTNNKLFVKIYGKDESGLFQVSLESLITLFVCKYVREIDIEIILCKCHQRTQLFLIDLATINYKYPDDIDEIVCELPYMLIDDNTLISGLCAVIRQIVKLSKTSQHLLGFKNGCLRAPNETSVLTQFCEIDSITMVYEFYKRCDWESKETIIPTHIIRFENHLSEPVRIHNIYKIAQNQNKTDQVINSTTPKENLNISHLYTEGPFMTIADIILWPQLHLIFQKLSIEYLIDKIPLTIKWYNGMLEDENLKIASIIIKSSKITPTNPIYIKPVVKVKSLYKSNAKRYKPRNQIYTNQNDIDTSLSIINQLPNVIKTPSKPYGSNEKINWDTVPKEASLFNNNGPFPSSRSKRKTEQLENLAKAVLKLAKPNDVIVDFCSGSGHLGIFVAILLPNCTVILLENKEESLARAKIQINKLNLSNVRLIQSNVDYFNGHFDIGMSLHACGMATDLVIQKCLSRNASFICCPCCYGGVNNCHYIKYPRSSIFKLSQLTLKDYLVLGHSADQTHDAMNQKTKQGELCMNIIDTDRILYAEEYNYYVVFGKLEPPTCTPKNNLLVGWPKEKEIEKKYT